MEKKSGPQEEVLETLNRNAHLAEEKRKQLRLEHNLAKLAQGNVEIIKSDEFIRGLIDYLLGHTKKDKDLQRKLLNSLGDATISEDINIRERALAVLSLAGEHFLQSGEKGGILLVVHSLTKWLEYEKEMLLGLVVVIKRMEELTLWLLENSFWKEGEKVIALFHQIQDGSNEKGIAFRSLVSQTLGKFATQATLEHLTDGYLLEDSNQPVFQSSLLYFETKASEYLLNRAIQSLSRKERLMLLHLLSAFGSKILPILEKCLNNNPPWEVVRNVLCILSEIGDDSCYTFTKQYYRHEDKRVQYEVICYIVRVGGSELPNRLLEGLGIVNDDLKVYIIQILAEHATKDGAVSKALFEFVENRNLFSSRSKNRLISAVIGALRFFPCIKSVEILRSLQFEYGKAPESQQMQLQIEEALKSIGPQLRHHQQRLEKSSETVSFDSDPLQMQKSLSALSSIEDQLQKLVRAGDMNGAGVLLHDQGLSAARAKNFFLAEKLRDRLLDINPMALTEAVALGELIEEEKTTSSHHLGVWSELYEEMSKDEFNALYSVMRQEEYRKDDKIVQAGETDDVLYFLNSGYVSLSCLSGGNENFLKRMGPGSILGGDQFFSASVWTVNLRALSDVHFQVLDHTRFLNIAEKFPNMGKKLRQYCHKYAEVPALLKLSRDDRREYPRFSVALYTQNVIFAPYGNKGQRSFKGELIDVSRSGLAFIVKISNQKNAKLMLGRQIFSEIQLNKGEILAGWSGVIVGVRYHDKAKKAFSVHVKLSQKIEDTVFSIIMALRQS